MLQRFTLLLDGVKPTLWEPSLFVCSIVDRLDQSDTYRQSALFNELYECAEPLSYEHLTCGFSAQAGLSS